MKPRSYFAPLTEEYQKARNAKYAQTMKHYMRDKFEFLGIKTPQRRHILRDFLRMRGLPQYQCIDAYMTYLWSKKHREYSYTGIEIMRRMKDCLNEEYLKTAEFMIINKSWWDTVDSLASGIVGPILIKDSKLMKTKAKEYNASSNMWLRRTSIIFQLSYKERTDRDILFENIASCSHEKEFFIQKAIGWALRQYARIDPQRVRSFVNTHELSALSRREAFKHIRG